MKKAYEQITVQVDPELVKKIDKMAAKLKVTRSTMVRNLLASAYEDAAILDKIGILTAFSMGQKLITKIKEGIASGRITYDQEGNLKIKE